MLEFKVEIGELAQVLEIQRRILERLDEIENRQLPEWVGLQEACKWKGVELKTVQNNAELRPPEHLKERVGRKDKWHRDVILEWATKGDRVLEAETEHRGLRAV